MQTSVLVFRDSITHYVATSIQYSGVVPEATQIRSANIWLADKRGRRANLNKIIWDISRARTALLIVLSMRCEEADAVTSLSSPAFQSRAVCLSWILWGSTKRDAS